MAQNISLSQLQIFLKKGISNLYSGMFLCWMFIAGLCLNTSAQHPQINLIPYPAQITYLAGTFELNTKTGIVATDHEISGLANQLCSDIEKSIGYHLKLTQERADKNGLIVLEYNKNKDIQLGTEGYLLHIKSDQIHIQANTAHGLFNGIQSLLQLVENNFKEKNGKTILLSCMKIKDYPRFGWRGLMLDVSRHFFSKEFIKKYLDEMARYKLNVFHWHLTDDNGWRIEIKGLPKLTEVGAWRVPRTGTWGTLAPQPGEAASYGGYYSQEDIKEIVRYASERFITIIPEIDVPGHSQALIAAYPGLSCSQQQYPVSNGAGNGNEHNVLCPSNDSVYKVLDIIYTQVAALFSGAYIHTGGDEVNYKFWKEHSACVELMKKKKLNTVEEYQAYFGKKVEQIIHSKGKKMACWYEPYFNDQNKQTTVYSWRGREDGIHMSQKGIPVVMSPAWDTYLDFSQGIFSSEPVTVIPGILRLKHCYEFDPIAEGANENYILGGQGNLWTESVPTERHAEYMTWPRALALAEGFWSPAKQKNWPSFVNRVENRFSYFKKNGINYSESFYNPIITGIKDSTGKYRVKLDSELPGTKLYYTFDGTNADAYSPQYVGEPLVVPREASQIRVSAYQNGIQIGKQIVCMLSEITHPNLR